MSWSFQKHGLPLSVIEQLTNMPVPDGQTVAGVLQFSAARSALIHAAAAARDNGVTEIYVAASGHADKDGVDGFSVNLTTRAAAIVENAQTTPVDSTAEIASATPVTPEERDPSAPEDTGEKTPGTLEDGGAGIQQNS